MWHDLVRADWAMLEERRRRWAGACSWANAGKSRPHEKKQTRGLGLPWRMEKGKNVLGRRQEAHAGERELEASGLGPWASRPNRWRG